MAISGLSTVLLRILNGNLVDVDLPLSFTQAFTTGYTLQQGVQITGATAITLPTPNVLLVYLKAVTNTLTVTWTPATGASAVVQNIAAGGFLLMMNPTAGITALTLTPVAANVTYDMLIGG